MTDDSLAEHLIGVVPVEQEELDGSRCGAQKAAACGSEAVKLNVSGRR
jgi:hypothetical protein